MNNTRIMILSEFWKIYEKDGIKNAIYYLEETKYYHNEDNNELNKLLESLSLDK